MHWNDAIYVSNLILIFICTAHGFWKGCLKPIVSLKWGEVSAGWKQARNKGLDSSLCGTYHFLCTANEWFGEICSALSCFRGRKIHYVSSYPPIVHDKFLIDLERFSWESCYILIIECVLILEVWIFFSNFGSHISDKFPDFNVTCDIFQNIHSEYIFRRYISLYISEARVPL